MIIFLTVTDVYNKLIEWVETGGEFPHMTFFPKNVYGVSFLCILAGGKIQQWQEFTN